MVVAAGGEREMYVRTGEGVDTEVCASRSTMLEEGAAAAAEDIVIRLSG